MQITSPATTYGAILLGSFFAFGLSGAVSLQGIVYFKRYPNDGMRIQVLVLTVWLLDLLHSSFLCGSMLNYFVTFFGQTDKLDFIPWTMAFTVIVTAIQTFLVHCFFVQKILKASEKNWFIAGPIVILTLCRLFAATVSTFEMIRLHQFSAFTAGLYPGWVFTTGLSLSAGVDVLIMASLCYYLRSIRMQISPDSTVMIRMVDSITIYTLENGALTCFTATASLICWVTMRKNLVFFGLHFIIGKLYANTLLASLNVREELERKRWQSWNRSRNRSNTFDSYSGFGESTSGSMARTTELNTFSSIIQPSKQQAPSHKKGARARFGGFQPREPTIVEHKLETA